MKPKFASAFLFLIIYSSLTFSQWTEINTGFNAYLRSVSAIDDNNVWVCGGIPPIILRTSNGGLNWINATGSGIHSSVAVTTIFALDNQIVLVSGYTGNGFNRGFDSAYVFKTINGGSSWSNVFSQDGGFVNGIWMKNSNEGIFIGDPVVNNYFTIQKTSNGGLNWYSGGSILGTSGEAGQINSLAVFGDNVWFGSNTNAKLYYSSNFGNSWNIQNPPGFVGGVTSIYFANSSTGMCGGYGSLAITTNGGVNWNAVTFPSTGYVNGLAGNGNWWINTKYGRSVYITSNSGTNWTLEYQIPDSSLRNHMSKSRNGNLLWDVRSFGKVGKRNTPLSVSQISSQVPLVCNLEQNYPNPFNPETKIRFDVIAAGLVKLSVYDINGKLISVLTEEDLESGKYEVTFYSDNLATGVYFYKLQSGNFSSFKKMIIVK
ncbi:MAG: T9SS type A sorting domain-containing protein [Ignavibacteria bacterium]